MVFQRRPLFHYAGPVRTRARGGARKLVTPRIVATGRFAPARVAELADLALTMAHEAGRFAPARVAERMFSCF